MVFTISRVDCIALFFSIFNTSSAGCFVAKVPVSSPRQELDKCASCDFSGVGDDDDDEEKRRKKRRRRRNLPVPGFLFFSPTSSSN